MKQIKLKIVTPEKILFEDIVSQVSVSTIMGEITILPNHIPLVSQLASGEIVIKTEQGREDLMAVSGGFIEVLPDQVVILADTAERAEDIEALGEMFTAKIEKELARLKVARKHKTKGQRPGPNS